VREDLRGQIEALDGVRFAVKDGANLVAVLGSGDQVGKVTKEIESILKQYQILELRFPMGFKVDTQEVGEQALAVLRSHSSSGNSSFTNVTSAEYGEDLDAFLKALVEMRDFLGSYASKVRISPEPQVRLGVGELLILEDGLIVEVTGVYGELVEAMIVEGSPVQARDKIVQEGS
jgi:hypothetical protein